MKNLLIATINENMGNGRIQIVCKKDRYGLYRWYCPPNDDPQGDWDLRAKWAR